MNSADAEPDLPQREDRPPLPHDLQCIGYRAQPGGTKIRRFANQTHSDTVRASRNARHVTIHRGGIRLIAALMPVSAAWERGVRD